MLRKGLRNVAVIVIDFDDTVKERDVVGAIRCMVDGCLERTPLHYEKSDSWVAWGGEAWGERQTAQVTTFLDGHACDPNRHPGRPAVLVMAYPSKIRENKPTRKS